MTLTDRLQALDHRQQQSPRLGFVAAVFKKFGDDHAGQLAALMSYYAFVSLFPLLLVFVTILGFVLNGDPEEQRKIEAGTLGQVPIISDQLKLHSFTGSTPALVIGIVLALLAGMGITNAAQSAFNRIWDVPYKDRPDFLHSRLRSLATLGLLGVLAIVSAVAGGFVGSSDHPVFTVVAGVLLAFLFNLALFMLAFKLLTAKELGWRDLIVGVVTASVFWQLLQHLGGYYVDHVLKHQQPLYGVFGLVLGLLAWLYLGAQLTILAAEVNAVRYHRLWPRSFFSPPLLDADKRALRSAAEAQERLDAQNVEVSFDGE
jgi:YihY family inner membrane protein